MPDPAPPTSVRRPGRPIWALCAMIFCLPLIGSALRKTRMVNDVETWLPSHDPGAQVLAWTQAHFEPENRFLISWDSSSLADPRVAALAERLHPQTAPAYPEEHPLHDIEDVITPAEVLSGMMSQGVPEPDAIHRLTGTLVGTGCIKVRLTDAGRQHAAEVQQQLQTFAENELHVALAIAPPLPQPPALAETDPTTTTESDESRKFEPAAWRPPAHDFQVHGPGLQAGTAAAQQLIAYARSLQSAAQPLVEDCFFAPGAPVALSVSIIEAHDDRMRATMQAVRDAARDVGIPLQELRLGGSPIGRIELNTASFKSLWNVDYPWWQFHKRSPFALSALVGTILAFVLLKSVRLALLVLFTAGYTAAATVALVPATGQTLNSVLVVMPNLMMVVTMSSLIHLANYWRHAAVAGLSDPVGQAVETSLEPTLLAGVTTSIGLASLVTSVLLPVRQFGLFSAAGCVLALGMVLWVFPALLRVFPGRPAPLAPPHENAWHWFGLWVARHRRAIGAICLALYGISFYGLTFFRTETKVIRYFPPYARIVQDYQFLEDNLAGIVGIDVILRFPPEKSKHSADEDDAAAATAPVLAARPDTVQLDLFQRMQLVRRMQERIQQLDGVSGAMSLADFRGQLEERPEQITAAYNRSLQVAKKRIFETRRSDTREFVTHAESPLSVELNGVPLRIEIGEEVWRIRAQCSVLKDRHYADFLDEIDTVLTAELRPYPGVDHFTTGMVPLFLRTQEALLESLINSFGVAFLTIAGVMMYQLRSFSAGALVMLPNILPIALTFGLISWYGIPLDVGTAITASIAMGIAVDSELHFVTWFKQSLQQGMSQDDAVAHGLVHCGPAMWQSCLVIALALQMLMFADLLMISRFGWLMAAMIIAAMLADLFFMPALLAGVMGRIIRRKLQQEAAAQPVPDRAATPAPAVTL